MQRCLQQHFASVPGYFLALPVTKQCWVYTDPFIPLQLMLRNLCTQAQELCYQSPAVFRRELLWLAGKRQRQACGYLHRTAHREGQAHRWDNRKEAGCRYVDGLGQKKMPFVGHKRMDSARGDRHLLCIAMFAYISHNEEKTSIFSGCLSSYFY